MIPPAFVRRWILAGAAVPPLAALASPALIPPASLLWLLAGMALLPRPRPPYPHKKRPMLHRLFFAWAAGTAALTAWRALSLPAPSGASGLAAGCVASLISARAFFLPLPRKWIWLCAAVLTALTLVAARL